jgi:phosphoheptose isomerase
MKTCKKFIALTFFVSLMVLSSCSECDNENPRARVSNMGTYDVRVLIETSGGDTDIITNIEPGKASEYRSYSPGIHTYTITLKNNGTIQKAVGMTFCSDYEIIIDQNNEIRTTSTDRD